MTYFVKYHNQLNLKPLQADLPFGTDTVCIRKELHLRQVSKVLDIPITILRELNPQYKHDILPAGPKICILSLPINYGDKFRHLKDSIFNYKDSVILATQPTMNMFPTAYYYPHSESRIVPGRSLVYHTVKSGETLGAVASKYHVTITDIKTWNHLSSNNLRIGQQLRLFSTQHVGSHSPQKKK
jgi:membrane-bound lytic murein transglycosylase D